MYNIMDIQEQKEIYAEEVNENLAEKSEKGTFEFQYKTSNMHKVSGGK